MELAEQAMWFIGTMLIVGGLSLAVGSFLIDALLAILDIFFGRSDR